MTQNHYAEARPDHWPDYAHVERLSRASYRNDPAERIEANIALVQAHRDNMTDSDRIARAERTLASLRNQLKAQLLRQEWRL